MEPERKSQTNGLAPIAIWSDQSPVIASPTVSKHPHERDIDDVTLSVKSSNASSGIGIDYPVKSSSLSSYLNYSPDLSSIGDEPDLNSINSAPPDETDDIMAKSTEDVQEKHNSTESQALLSVLNNTYKSASVTFINDSENDLPNAEGVKFVGLPDKDSICSSSSDDDNDEEDPKDAIPDGGWGWIVVLSSLVISMIADGISFSFGLLYIEFLEHFNESKSKTSWIGSLFVSVPLLSGPIMSALVDKYGCRKMTMLGGIISSFGFVLASFSNSIEVLYITFGTMAGLGLGLCYVTAVVSIAYWFDKRRNLAVGLGACGTGVGTFVYAPMTQYFIQEYGWRGTILLLAGTLLNLCVCGAVMRDPEWWIEEQKRQVNLNKSMKGSSCASISGRSGGGESVFPGMEELKSLIQSGEKPEYILTTLVTSIAAAETLEETTKDNATEQHRVNSLMNLPTFLKQSEKVPLEVLESLSSNRRVYNVILENYPSLLSFRSCSEQQIHNESQEFKTKPVTMSMKIKPTKPHKSSDLEYPPLLVTEAVGQTTVRPRRSIIVKPKPEEPWLRRQFSTNRHYLKDIKMHRNSVMYRGAMMNISKYRLRASSCPNIYRNSMITIAEKEEKWYSEIVDMFNSMFDFSMFLEFHFLLLCLSNVLLFTWFVVPYFYLAEHLTRNNYTEDDAALLLSIVGITNTIGMVGFGWAGDQPWMNVTKTYSVCLFLCGTTVLSYPLFTFSYPLLAVNSALFGLFFASSFSFTPVILVELIPLERFTTAYGLTLLCQGIGHLIGPPLAALIFDKTGFWDISFYVAGFWIIVSGIHILIIPFTRNFRIWGSAPLEKDAERVSQASQNFTKDSNSIA